jgi:hypothetical protein
LGEKEDALEVNVHKLVEDCFGRTLDRGVQSDARIVDQPKEPGAPELTEFIIQARRELVEGAEVARVQRQRRRLPAERFNFGYDR